MSDLSKTIDPEKWGNPLSVGLFADTAETKDMTHDELRAWAKAKGVIIVSSTQENK